MRKTPRLKVRSLNVLSAALIATVVLPGCGGKPLVPAPEIKIISSRFQEHAVGGPNSLLTCDVELRFVTGDQMLEIVETTADKSEVRFSFSGSGNSKVTLELQKTFVNDGDTARQKALLERLPAEVHWPESMSPGETATFLEYEGLDGTPVRYEMRLR
jgi:hypothetical protein